MPSVKPLQPLVLDSLGVSGLNTQSNTASLEHNWLVLADNVMIDEEGRVASRKGLKQVSVGLSDATSSVKNKKIIKSFGERIKKDGTAQYWCGIDTDVYALDTTKTPYTLTAETFQTGSTARTDGNWQFTSFNGNLYGVQRGHKIISYGEDTEAWEDLEDVTTPSFVAPNPAPTNFKPSCSLGDFGSLWVAGSEDNKNIIYRSDNLSARIWDGGTAGQIDLQTVWGNDEVVALASFVNKLVIFGKRNIAIYVNPWDAGVSSSTFQLEDLIKGIGCVARDSVQSYGDDVIFLSANGIRSLARTTEKTTLPLTDLTKNLKDDVNRNIPSTDTEADKVKSIYDSEHGIYVLTLGHILTTYALDFKKMNQDGTPVITKWVPGKVKQPTAYLATVNRKFWAGHGSEDLVGDETEGSISVYQNYIDTTLSDVTSTYGTQSTCEAAGNTWESTNSECWSSTNSNYESKFKSVWMDFGAPGISKLLKRLTTVVTGGKNAVMTLEWFRDYETSSNTASITLESSGVGGSSLWGDPTSLYDTSTYTPSASTKEYRVPLSKSAKVMQLGVTNTVAGEKAAIQNITILAKTGKVR